MERTVDQDTLYLYGLDLIAQVQPDGSRRTYHTDALGSVRTLSNSSGQVVGRYTYDVFGGIRSQTDGSGNPFTFTGEQVDGEIGLVFLRARYYDPWVGRFVSPDPFAGLDHRSQSLNRYPYTQNNPIRYVDPNGEVIITSIIGLGIAGGALVAYLSYPEPANAPGPSDPTYAPAPFRPVVHAVLSVAVSKLLEPAENFVRGSGHATSLWEGLLKWVSGDCGASCLLSGSLVGANLGLAEESIGQPAGDWLDQLLYPDFGKPFSRSYRRSGYGGGGGGSWGGPPSGGK